MFVKFTAPLKKKKTKSRIKMFLSTALLVRGLAPFHPITYFLLSSVSVMSFTYLWLYIDF